MEVTLTVGSQRESRESNVIEPIRKAGRQLESHGDHQLPRIFWRHMSVPEFHSSLLCTQTSVLQCVSYCQRFPRISKYSNPLRKWSPQLSLIPLSNRRLFALDAGLPSSPKYKQSSCAAVLKPSFLPPALKFPPRRSSLLETETRFFPSDP